MIATIILLLLVSVCAPLSTDVLPPGDEPAPPSYKVDNLFPNFSVDWNNFYANSEVTFDMQSETIKDMMRQGIVEKSVQVLRNHGKSDEEIRSIILKDFHISAETLDDILKR